MRTLAEILHDINVGISVQEVFRVRQASSLRDYLAIDCHRWIWVRGQVNIPKLITSVELEPPHIGSRGWLDCGERDFVLLSSCEEMKVYRMMTKLHYSALLAMVLHPYRLATIKGLRTV